MKNLWNKIRNWKDNLRKRAIDDLLRETGVDLQPEPGVWGWLSPSEQAHEQIILARLYQDKEFMALLRKYAEGSNKAMINRTSTDQEYWKFRGQFFCYNSMLFKCRRAFIKLQKNEQSRA